MQVGLKRQKTGEEEMHDEERKVRQERLKGSAAAR